MLAGWATMKDDGRGVFTYGAAQSIARVVLGSRGKSECAKHHSEGWEWLRVGSRARLREASSIFAQRQRSLLKMRPPSTDVDLCKNQRLSMLEAWCGKGAHQSGPRGDLISELASSWQVDPAIRKRRNEGTRLPTKK